MLRRLPRVLMLAAAAALLWSGASAAGPDVRIDIGLGVPPIVHATPPQLVVVPGTSVYYAPDVPSNYFFYKGRYYTVANGVWSRAPAYNGPWAVIQIGQVPPPVLAVPLEYYKIPPGHLKKHGPPPWAGQGHGPHPKKPKHK
jgi:WXXGXW repeat (2 copies)